MNRAGKPKLLLSPSPTTINTTLRPSSPFLDDKVSPFSTPPSSDESLEKVGPHNTLVRLLKVDPATQASIGQNKGRTAVSTQRVRTPDAPALNLNQSATLITDRGSKPALPLRRQPGRLQRGSNLLQATSSTATPEVAPSHGEAQAFGVKEQIFLPPPKRIATSSHPKTHARESSRKYESDFEGEQAHVLDPARSSRGNNVFDLPDPSGLNRKFPYCSAGARRIDIGHDARLIDVCGARMCAIGHFAGVWDVTTGETLLSLGQSEREIRYTATAFKPGTKSADEGSRLWLGTSHGDLLEVDILSQGVVYTKSGAHERREISKIHRHQNAMWTIDNGGKLCNWLGQADGLPSLQGTFKTYRVQKNHTCSLIVQDCLWLASGKDIWIYRPGFSVTEEFRVLQKPLCQPHIGSITSTTVVNSQMDRIYFGHSDGKISVYSVVDYTCLSIVNSNVYKINSLAGAGSMLWAAISIGMIYVFDTSTQPWMMMKAWPAHDNSPVVALVADRSSLWKEGDLRLLSLGCDNTIRSWDGALKDDWLGEFLNHSGPESETKYLQERDMHNHDIDYCTFRELSAFVMTWNAGAATPGQLRHDQSDFSFLADLLSAKEMPDLLVFGFQELVDLEDKRLTASRFWRPPHRQRS